MVPPYKEKEKHMKRILGTFAFVAVAFTFTGCKGSPEEQAVKLMEELAELSDKNKEDCDKMGEALGKFMEKNGETFKKLKDMDKGKSEEDKKKLEEKYGERIKKAMGKMMPAQLKCKDNKKVQDAMKKM